VGYDLNVDVLLYCHEKDLPATKQRMQLLENCVVESKEKEAILTERLHAINTTSTKEDLVRFLLDEHSTLKETLDAEEAKLNFPICNLTTNKTAEYYKWPPPTLEETIAGLARLLIALKERSVLPGDLSEGSWSTVLEFLQRCQMIEQLRREAATSDIVKQFKGKECAESPFGGNQGRREEVQPVLHAICPASVTALKDRLMEAMPAHWNLVKSYLLEGRSVPLGVTCAVSALIDWSDVRKLILFVLGVYVMMIGVVRYMEDLVEVIARERESAKAFLENLKNDLRAHMHGAKEDITQVLTETINVVDRKIHAQGPPRQERFDSPVLLTLKLVAGMMGGWTNQFSVLSV